MRGYSHSKAKFDDERIAIFVSISINIIICNEKKYGCNLLKRTSRTSLLDRFDVQESMEVKRLPNSLM